MHCCRRGRHSRGRQRRAFCPSRNRNSSGIPLAASGLGSLPGKAGPQRVIERDPGAPGTHAACACLLHPELGCRLSHSLLCPPSFRSAWTSAPLWELSLSPRPVPTWPTSVCDLRGPCTRPSPGRDPSAQGTLPELGAWAVRMGTHTDVIVQVVSSPTSHCENIPPLYTSAELIVSPEACIRERVRSDSFSL